MDFQALGEQLNDWVDWILGLGVFWIYAAVVVASFIENIFPPFPGDTVTIVGAALATTGRLDLVLVFFGAWLGGIISVMLIYSFGKSHGHEYFINRNFKYFPREKLKIFEEWLDRRGAWLIVGSRFVVGFRTLISLAAGIGKWPAWQMFLYSSISFWLFNSILILATYYLIDNLPALTQYIKVYQYLFWPLIIFLAAGYLIMRRRKAKQKRGDSSR